MWGIIKLCCSCSSVCAWCLVAALLKALYSTVLLPVHLFLFSSCIATWRLATFLFICVISHHIVVKRYVRPNYIIFMILIFPRDAFLTAVVLLLVQGHRMIWRRWLKWLMIRFGWWEWTRKLAWCHFHVQKKVSLSVSHTASRLHSWLMMWALLINVHYLFQ